MLGRYLCVKDNKGGSVKRITFLFGKVNYIHYIIVLNKFKYLKMNRKQLEAFLDSKRGYVKKGSKALTELLEEQGKSLVGLTQQDVKDILRNKARGKNFKGNTPKPLSILTYDIETSLVEAQLWGSGKQYVGHDSITTETQIITVAWKWIGSNKVDHLKWSMKKRSDKKLVKKFLEEYNKADMVIGWNNNSFDNKIVHSRAMKYGLNVNTLVKSYDIMRQVKKVFRLPSYSMAYVSKYLGLGGKLSYGGGIRMWKDIQWGTKQDAKVAMKTMIAYNVQDVALTEEIYIKLRQYLGHVIHAGVLQGKSKMTCPHCGSDKLKKYQSSVSTAGVMHHIMKCKKDGVKFRVSNTEYLKTL